jgi:hypothetical protein
MLLAIKVERNDNIHYSKPFFLNNESDEVFRKLHQPAASPAAPHPGQALLGAAEVFVAQIIRDVDFSFIVEQDDDFILTILSYNDKNDYYRLNTNVKPSKEPEIFGIYPIFFKNNNENSIKTHFNSVLDKEYDLKITFNVMFRKIENDYILSTPTLSGNKIFLSL